MKNEFKNQILSQNLESNIIEDISDNTNNELTYQEMAQNEGEEDATKYGEFVTSYFAWVPLSKQKENVEKLENITKKKEK